MNYSNKIENIKPSFIREILKATNSPGMISFAGGLPNNSLFPFGELRKSTELLFDLEKAAKSLQYAGTEGSEGLRGIIAKQFQERSGVKVGIDNILLTSGAQQAITMISKLFLDETDTAGMESPGYLGAKQAFGINGNKIQEIGMDAEGIKIEDLEKHKGIKLLYINPTFQNPSGLVYTDKRRTELSQWVNDNDTVLLEDDPYSDLMFGESSEPISTKCQSKALYVGTFSKTLAPSLRIGYIIAKESFVSRLKILKQGDDLYSSNILQQMTLTYFHNYNFENHKKRLRRFYKAKRDFMQMCLDKEFGNLIEYRIPEGGFFFWVKFKGLNTSNLLDEAKKYKILFVPGNCFGEDSNFEEFGRLNFSYSSNTEIHEGVLRLKKAYQSII